MNATKQNLFDDPVRGLRDLAEFLPLRALGAAIQCVDPEQNLQTAATFGALYARIASKRTARAKSNILRSLPGTTETEAERLAVESIRYMFRLFLVDSLAMPNAVQPHLCSASALTTTAINAWTKSRTLKKIRTSQHTSQSSPVVLDRRLVEALQALSPTTRT